jgi:dolichol-phosphate mannosyltransferase
MPNDADFSIILPTLNEAKSIGRLIDKLKKEFSGEILISDDGSTDSTVSIAKKKGAKILNRRDALIHGLIISVIDASKIAKGKYVIVMDSDFQHPPHEIGRLVRAMRNNDLIICHRISLNELTPIRRIISVVASWLAFLRLGKDYRDPLSGFFCCKKEMLINLKNACSEPRGFKILFEILKKNPNAKIDYFDYDFAIRKSGVSKLNFRQIWYFLKAIAG